jgi:hypothetical protein
MYNHVDQRDVHGHRGANSVVTFVWWVACGSRWETCLCSSLSTTRAAAVPHHHPRQSNHHGTPHQNGHTQPSRANKVRQQALR